MFNSLKAQDVEPGMNVILGVLGTVYQVDSVEISANEVVLNLLLNTLRLQFKTNLNDDLTIIL